jgi:predicted amidohydrolase
MNQAQNTAAIDIAVLPEHFNAVQEQDGETVQWQSAMAFAANLARLHRTFLIAGSVERWDPQRQARVNTALLFDRQGQEIARYDKRQLFGFERRKKVQAGERPLVVNLEGVRCAVLICADLWYPELVREVAQRSDLLCVPAQTTVRPESQPSYAHLLWHSLAMTRAQENVLAVAVSDQAANSLAPYRCGGVSSITDPSAQPDLAAIQHRINHGTDGFLWAQIDLERLAQFRAYRRQNGLLPADGNR